LGGHEERKISRQTDNTVKITQYDGEKNIMLEINIRCHCGMRAIWLSKKANLIGCPHCDRVCENDKCGYCKRFEDLPNAEL
jgi:hypothetical protein